MMRLPRLNQLCTRQDGSILVMTGLWLLVLVAVGGAGFDLARQQLVRLKIQQASDTAALSAALMPAGTSVESRQAEAQRIFKMNYPDSYVGVERPLVQVDVDKSVTVTAQTNMETSFMGVVGINTLNSKGRSVVRLGANANDFDIVMVVDESISTSGGCPKCGGKSLMEIEQASIVSMLDTIFPSDVVNPDVRFGLIGYTQYISNKWGMTSIKKGALKGVEHLRSRNANFDHFGLEAGYNMITGNITVGTINSEVPEFTSDKIYDCTDGYRVGLPNGHECLRLDLSRCVIPRSLSQCYAIHNSPVAKRNTDVPPARTERNGPNGDNAMSPNRYLVFITDGLIMYEPDGCRFALWFGQTPVVGAPCPNYPEFLKQCDRIKDAGVTLYTISFYSQEGGDAKTLKACASVDPTTGDKHYYFAPDGATLKSILQNIGAKLNKVRITE